MAYRGFLAPGAKMGIGAPPFGVSDWQAQRCSPSPIGNWVDLGRSPSRINAFGTWEQLGCKWNPFLNSLDTIFNSACQTGKGRRRSVALFRYWGSGAELQPPTLLGAFGCEWNPFLNSLNTIFNSACQTGKGRRRTTLLLGGAPAANAFGSVWM